MTDKINDTNNIQLTITTTVLNVAFHSVNSKQFFVGIFLALLSSLFIGSSFILKKKGLLNLTNYNGSVRAGSGGFGYLYEIQWWAGLATMGLGELCNFAAYGFAPASIVTPLGALSVLVSALMAVRYLNENLDTLGKIGCLLTVFGSIVLIIHAPKESEVNSLFDFARKISSLEFVVFSFITCVTILCLMIYYGPRFGSKYVHIYILICSLLGAFTVTACKGLGTGLKEFFTHDYSYSIWLTFSCAIVIIVCILIQMVYLNRALDLFATPIVTTVYYVLFTTCVLITSGILFHEWRLLTLVDIIACLVGFSITTCGLILINYVKTNTLSNGIQSMDMHDKSLFSYLHSNSQLSSTGSSSSTSVVAVKQQHYIPAKAYANLLFNDNNIQLSTNAINEQCQPLLLIDECDFNF
ncbi:unnamed protein product [Rotaria sp. Silwood1]|nr:unnamed protein product [Rotaria sp. Silwood1]CAF3339166.1 unnamed protein product [Rotaria sp. Silwood1]CAF3342778.1 unnamed protein product [Rotaria sp. Silwood1]CAF3347211.1 unnamed protein product [Rotaria sp. Silwood1]CAF4524258.1 unnamed protein product [Rotaria sp. Silwood1]